MYSHVACDVLKPSSLIWHLMPYLFLLQFVTITVLLLQFVTITVLLGNAYIKASV